MKCLVCGNSYTGDMSRKVGRYYYKCESKGCCCNRSAIKVHALFTNLLLKIKIDEKKYPGLKKEFTSNFIKINEIGPKNVSIIKANLTNVKNKIEFLEKRFVFNEISRSLYKKYLSKLKEEQEHAEQQLDKLRVGLFSNEELDLARESILKNLPLLWSTGSLDIKRVIQTTIFSDGIYFDKPKNELIVKKLGPGFFLQNITDLGTLPIG